MTESSTGNEASTPLTFGRLAVLVVALSVALGFVEAGQIYLSAAAVGEPKQWWSSVMSVMPSWLIFAALIPGVLYLARRFPLDQPHWAWRRNIPVHGVAGVLFAVLHLLGTAMAYHTPKGWEAVVFWFSTLMRFYFVLDVLTYWAIVGAWHALRYYRASRDRALANAHLEASLADARLQALRSQLDPHFLFNTLNAVSTLAAQGRADAIVDVVTRLSQLLRLTLDERRAQEVSLRKELEFLDLYLDIQRLRFADRLTVRTEIAPDTLDALVPTLLLQPLVENALLHGVGAQAGPGQIGVRATRENRRLRIQVDDSGPGFGGAADASGSSGIGLSNTRARLAQLYGPNHSLVFGTGPAGGALVTIAIPFRSSASPEEAHA